MESEETEEKESVRKTEKERHEMKYKVGDKVRVRRDLQIGTPYGDWLFSSGMNDYKGKVVTISGTYPNKYRVREDKERWVWTDEMLEGLVEDELTAEEAIKILGEICCENKCFNGCPIGKARGKMSCHFFRRDKPKEVLEILKQRKKEREKKEVEVTQKIYCLVVDKERKVVHEEEIGNSDSCMDVLKNYCENHDGKFFSLMEFRYEVKQQ